MHAQERRPRAPTIAVSSALIVAGLMFALPFLVPYGGASAPALLAPTLLILGVEALVRGLLGARRSFSGGWLLGTGLLMLFVGAYPWAYVGLLETPWVGWPGSEGSCMLGVLIQLSVGLPGLLLALAAWVASA